MKNGGRGARSGKLPSRKDFVKPAWLLNSMTVAKCLEVKLTRGLRNVEGKKTRYLTEGSSRRRGKGVEV